MKSSRGHALLSVVAIVGALLVAGVAAVRMTRSELHGTAVNVARQKALYIAEAGVQHALARLSQERTTASASTAYTYSASNQTYGEGNYSVRVVQDPLNPADASRKQITGIGTALGQQATVVAQAQVQDTLPSTVCYTDEGTCRIYSAVAAATELFDGEIFSNNNVEIGTAVGLQVRGNGNVYARNQFSAPGLVLAGIGGPGAILSTTNARLYSGVAYSPAGLLSTGTLAGFQSIFGNLIGTLVYSALNALGLGALNDPHTTAAGQNLTGLGLHFANGTYGHGEVTSIAKRAFPEVDWERIREDADEIVNAENVPSGTTWDAASGTWIVPLLSCGLDEEKAYYVEGNVHVTSLDVLKGADVTIAARGWSVVENLSVLNAGLLPGSTQSVHIIAEKKNAIGLDLITYTTPTLENELNSLIPGVSPATGIGLNVAGVLTTKNRIFAYSETDDVWAKTSTLLVGATNNRVSLIAKKNATLGYTGTILSSMKPYE